MANVQVKEACFYCSDGELKGQVNSGVAHRVSLDLCSEDCVRNVTRILYTISHFLRGLQILVFTKWYPHVFFAVLVKVGLKSVHFFILFPLTFL